MVLARLASDERPQMVHQLRILGSWVEKLRGLLGTSERAMPVMITRCGSVHTFGMGYPIDIAFVGELGEVLEVRREVEPGMFASNRDACCVIERPASSDAWIEKGEHLWIVAMGLG